MSHRLRRLTTAALPCLAALLALPAVAEVEPAQPAGGRVLFDGNGSWPSLESGAFKVNGDLTAGYTADRWGAVARGSFLTYELATRAKLTRTSRVDGSAEGWRQFSLGGPVALELRGELGASWLDSGQVTADDASVYRGQTSLLLQGGGLAGLEVRLAGFSFSLSAGAQAQWEDWSSTARPPGPGPGQALSQSRASASGEGRLRLHWSAWPEVLSVRGRADLTVQSLTRNDVAGPAGVPSATPSGQAATQLDLRVRGLVDLEALRFLGFLPSLHFGLNYERVDADAHLSPVLGLGLRRATL